MSPVEVVLIVFFAVLAVYFAIGAAVRYKGGVRRCPDMLPNFRFWRWVVFLVRDGILFTTSCGKYRPQPQSEGKVLPTNPRTFDHLPADEGDEGDNLDDDDFNEPAVVVQY